MSAEDWADMVETDEKENQQDDNSDEEETHQIQPKPEQKAIQQSTKLDIMISNIPLSIDPKALKIALHDWNYDILRIWNNKDKTLQIYAISIHLVDGKPKFDDIIARNLVLDGNKCRCDYYDGKNKYHNKYNNTGRQKEYRPKQQNHYRTNNNKEPPKEVEFKIEERPAEKKLKLLPPTKKDSTERPEDHRNIFGGAVPRAEPLVSSDTTTPVVKEEDTHTAPREERRPYNGAPREDRRPYNNGAPREDRRPYNNGAPREDRRPYNNGAPREDRRPNNYAPGEDRRQYNSGAPREDRRPHKDGFSKDDHPYNGPVREARQQYPRPPATTSTEAGESLPPPATGEQVKPPGYKEQSSNNIRRGGNRRTGPPHEKSSPTKSKSSPPTDKADKDGFLTVNQKKAHPKTEARKETSGGGILFSNKFAALDF